ncbi:MAG: hypothetical protein A2381_18455 [Bdellovibrionales bacterium RIFOXYB1_FULL_37_110]|nr:MAG: hypothetical protein A2417_01315 [Bdellovibrionales bacterium RIFOXYC1_FULL_37_79]OFZ59013.1 MAG: hypothetical protein A2381_18455 [Bdellovibrionales bacterium RIFOXYB1_FULL_37_110]OFZ65118.1 MAG: hypothetical protein A2577_04770 [Bdellovibrionales bacterium RIFOXYD1_FULL_36_51]
MKDIEQKNASLLNFIYGTAWKEELTKDCVINALKAGYLAIDTANQRKHYYEKGVGEALVFAQENFGINRKDIFLQTKFTYLNFQDDRLPYSKQARVTLQVQQSFESSLEHLQTNYIDSYLLHGPSNPDYFSESDWEAWSAMENLYNQNKVKYLGVANINHQQLVDLYQKSRVKPHFVQNRCYASIKWDNEIRRYCQKNNIVYQGFAILTGSKKYLGGVVLHPIDRTVPQLVLDEHSAGAENIHSTIRKIIHQTGKSIPQIMYRFVQQLGVVPLTGTRSKDHMISNLQIGDLKLTLQQVNQIMNIELT